MVVAIRTVQLGETRMDLPAVQIGAEGLLHPGGQLAAVVLDPRQEVIEVLSDDPVQ